MSAMMTGVKSFQGGFAISPNGKRGVCDAIENAKANIHFRFSKVGWYAHWTGDDS